MFEKRKSNVFGEIEYIAYLEGNGYPVASPIKSLNNNHIEIADTPWGQYYVTVFEEASGTKLSQLGLTEDIVFSYGKALGRMHYLSSKYVPNIGNGFIMMCLIGLKGSF